MQRVLLHNLELTQGVINMQKHIIVGLQMVFQISLDSLVVMQAMRVSMDMLQLTEDQRRWMVGNLNVKKTEGLFFEVFHLQIFSEFLDLFIRDWIFIFFIKAKFIHLFLQPTCLPEILNLLIHFVPELSVEFAHDLLEEIG